MGFSISWIAVRGIAKANLLAQLGLRDLSTEDEADESPFSSTEIATGWSIVWSNDFDYGSAEHLRDLAGGMIIACQVEEHIMFSAAHCRADGRDVWSVWHDGQRGERDLTTSGTPPVELTTISTKLFAKQNEDPSSTVDYGFDIPIALGEAITGFRHDLWDFPWGGRPYWTAVTPR